MGKVIWKRVDGVAQCYVDEGNGWIHWKESELWQSHTGFKGFKDNNGMACFQLALRQGYKYVENNV